MNWTFNIIRNRSNLINLDQLFYFISSLFFLFSNNFMDNIKISLLQIKIQESSKFKYHYLCKILIKKKKNSFSRYSFIYKIYPSSFELISILKTVFAQNWTYSLDRQFRITLRSLNLLIYTLNGQSSILFSEPFRIVNSGTRSGLQTLYRFSTPDKKLYGTFIPCNKPDLIQFIKISASFLLSSSFFFLRAFPLSLRPLLKRTDQSILH